eukprot:1055041-Pyramimonas_sp.AAC.1
MVPVGVLAQSKLRAVGQAEGVGPGIHARPEPHTLLAICSGTSWSSTHGSSANGLESRELDSLVCRVWVES